MPGRGQRTSPTHEPALDGLRGVAVVLVLLFHGGATWVPGGYLGVSLFFTLSGFLITRLLLAEVETTGTVRLGTFYARRARRLLPASLVCLLGVIVVARAGGFEGVGHLRRDLGAALLQVVNWVQLGGDRSYGDLISDSAGLQPPLEHYWSLAIEEQFYWLWPLAVLAATRHVRTATPERRRRAVTRMVVIAAVVAAVAAPLIAAIWGPDAAYWSTPARAAEILFGGAGAALYASGHLRRVPSWLGPVALAAILVGAATLPSDRGVAYEGGFVVVAAVSTVLLLALRRPSWLRGALSWRPLVAVGAVSYGLYLYHWPVFVLLDEERTGWNGAGLFLLRMLVTTAVTVVSYHLLEWPVRRATWRPRRTLAVGAVAVTAALAAVALVPSGPGEYWATDRALADAAAIRPDESPTPLATVPAPSTTAVGARDSAADAGAPTRPVRILVVGDSTALAAASGLTRWAVDHPRLAQVSSITSPQCGFVRGGEVRGDTDPSLRERCDRMLDEQLVPRVERLRPDVVALLVSSRDSLPRTWTAADGLLGPGDDRFVARIEADYRQLTDRIAAAAPAAAIAWIRPPIINPWWKDVTGGFADLAGHAAVDGVAARLAAAEPERIHVVDLRGWMEGNGYATRQDLRPDGIHFTQDAAALVATEWLGPSLVAVALR